MITQELCVKIFNAHQEIKKAKEMLVKLHESAMNGDKNPVSELKDDWGNKSGLMLGIPTSDTGHRLIGISTELAILVIEDHIKTQEKRLKEYNTIARLQVMDPQSLANHFNTEQ